MQAEIELNKSGNPDTINPWTFYDFLDGRFENNEIRQWLDSLPEKAAAKIDVRILYMCSMTIWPEQYVSALVGWPKLFELRVVFSGNQYRLIGFYGPQRGEFTLVLGAIEKGKLPRRILQLADDNRKLAIADRRRICRHVFAKGPASS